MLLRDLWGQPKANAHDEDSTGAAARGLLLLFPLKKCPRPPREMVFGVHHLRIRGTKGSLRWWFLDPTIYVLRTGHIIDNIRADIYDSFFGNNAEMGSFHNTPRNSKGREFHQKFTKLILFFLFFWGSWKNTAKLGTVGGWLFRVPEGGPLTQFPSTIATKNQEVICCQKIIICSLVPSFR